MEKYGNVSKVTEVTIDDRLKESLKVRLRIVARLTGAGIDGSMDLWPADLD